MEYLIANVEHFKFDIEVALDEQYGALPLPFSGMDKSTAAVCQFHSSKNGCANGANCPFRHVKGDRTIVCKHWLRGLCKKGDQCEFLHEYDMTKMPECYFYSRFNACHNKECPFLHIDPESKIKDCPWYDRGFCRHGPHCRHRHVRRVLCTNFLAGFCPEGIKCKYMHPRFELPAPPDQKQQDKNKPPVIICHFCGEHGHKALHCNKMSEHHRHKEMQAMLNADDGKKEIFGQRPQLKKLEDVTCYKCGSKGHYANKCPKGHLAFLSQKANQLKNEQLAAQKAMQQTQKEKDPEQNPS
ncbi:cleavage and polyadenylation specificity factor subunit 4 [Euwallacea similis]|uniref:cleavage and polyadenylation specificity factor subunit 4 n=1 Tax=Euwallacea similis TaxID=1736056 RepID=UPI00344D354B